MSVDKFQSTTSNISESQIKIPSDWTTGSKIIFFGIGNVGRQDDGLGIRFIESLESIPLPSHIGLEGNYQLNAEDALAISEYDIVVFVDATMAPQARAPYEIRAVQPSAEVSFSTHAMSMGSVLAFCQQLYNKRPKAYSLAIPGSAWNMTAGLSEIMSDSAQANLKATLDSITSAFQLPPIPHLAPQPVSSQPESPQPVSSQSVCSPLVLPKPETPRA
jgi:hydrogenase maturation protease